jgi:phosphatidylserine decarboxylase
MSSYPHPIIAREGWPFVAIGVTIAGWAAVAIVAWLATLFILQFFRDPKREVPQQRNAVLSPADGTIVKVEQARDPSLNRDALLISVFMNVFNVHSNRSPVDGEVAGRWYREGKFFNASLDKASSDKPTKEASVCSSSDKTPALHLFHRMDSGGRLGAARRRPRATTRRNARRVRC